MSTPSSSSMPYESPNELIKWAVVKFDGHLYTCRTGTKESAIIHSPDCPCLIKKEEKLSNIIRSVAQYLRR